ncbi:MAG: 2'-5' RNA ligase family protein [Pseudomonadota bacterium]
MPTPEEITGLVVLVPEAEACVGALRREHAPDAPLGMPPHVTVLYPFAPMGALDQAALRRLERAVAGCEPFEVVLDTVGTFPGVVYLTPTPRVGFERLTAAVVRAFPAYPPYGGLAADPTPHLTVGVCDDEEGIAALEAWARGALCEHGPIRSRAREVWLVRSMEGKWCFERAFALGGGPRVRGQQASGIMPE